MLKADSQSAINLLFACCSPPGPAQRQVVGELLVDPNLNWDQLKVIARNHRMEQALYFAIASNRNLLQESFLSGLTNRVHASSVRSNKLLQELSALFHLANGAGINCVALKGVALAERLYGDCTMRHAGDLDILIAPTDVAKFAELIRQRGYKIEEITKQLLEHGCEMAGRNPETRITIDLHWGLASKKSKPLSIGKVFDSTTFIDTAAGKIQVLNYANDFIYLIIHAANHGWSALRWLADLSVYCSLDEFDTDEVLQVAATNGSRRMTLLALAMVAELPGVTLAPSVQEHLRTERALVQQAQKILQNVEPDLKTWAQLSYESRLTHFQTRDNLGDLCQAISEFAFQTTLGDVHAWALPRQLSWMYPLLRPIRILREHRKLTAELRTNTAKRPSTYHP